jgi:hypothetical protein
VLLYGESPASGEPTLELYRRAVPIDRNILDAASGLLASALERWGWGPAVDAANGCLTAILAAVVDAGAESIELFAFRRVHQLNVEVHFCGTQTRFRELLASDVRLGRIELLSELWGVRALNDGEAVWFELRRPEEE